MLRSDDYAGSAATMKSTQVRNRSQQGIDNSVGLQGSAGQKGGDFYAKLGPVPYMADLMNSRNDSNLSSGIPWVKAINGIKDVSKSMSISLSKAGRSHNSQKNLSEVEKLKQMIDLPGTLSNDSSTSTISTGNYKLMNDKKRNKIVLKGEIVDSSHLDRHNRFLDYKKQLLNEPSGLISPEVYDQLDDGMP